MLNHHPPTGSGRRYATRIVLPFLFPRIAVFLVVFQLLNLWPINHKSVKSDLKSFHPMMERLQVDDDAVMTETFLFGGNLSDYDDDGDDQGIFNNRLFCELEPCGVSIVFLGDSLTRFQYYSLVYFLRHGEWIDPAWLLSQSCPSQGLSWRL